MALAGPVHICVSGVGDLRQHLLKTVDDLNACLEIAVHQSVAQVIDEGGRGDPALHLGVGFLLLNFSFDYFFGPVPDLTVNKHTQNVIVRAQKSDCHLHGVV